MNSLKLRDKLQGSKHNMNFHEIKIWLNLKVNLKVNLISKNWKIENYLIFKFILTQETQVMHN